MQFELSYNMGISLTDLGNTSIYKINWFYDKLVERRRKEREAANVNQG